MRNIEKMSTINRDSFNCFERFEMNNFSARFLKTDENQSFSL